MSELKDYWTTDAKPFDGKLRDYWTEAANDPPSTRITVKEPRYYIRLDPQYVDENERAMVDYGWTPPLQIYDPQ